MSDPVIFENEYFKARAAKGILFKYEDENYEIFNYRTNYMLCGKHSEKKPGWGRSVPDIKQIINHSLIHIRNEYKDEKAILLFNELIITLDPNFNFNKTITSESINRVITLPELGINPK